MKQEKITYKELLNMNGESIFLEFQDKDVIQNNGIFTVNIDNEFLELINTKNKKDIWKIKLENISDLDNEEWLKFYKA